VAVEDPLGAQGDALVHQEDDAARGDVVHEVVAHGQVGDDGDALVLQVGAGPHAGQHEDLGRVDGAGGEDDFPARAHGVAPPVADELHARGLLGHGVDQYPGHDALLAHVEVLAVLDGAQVRPVGAPSRTVLHRHLQQSTSRNLF